MASDDVQLPDLMVIQQFSLAVRTATAPRAAVIAALESDLAFLTRGARRRTVPAAPSEALAAKPAAKPAAAPPAASSARVRRSSTPRAAVIAPPQGTITVAVADLPDVDVAAVDVAAVDLAEVEADKPTTGRAPRP